MKTSGVGGPVRLRMKKLAGGGTSLYLDIYVCGRRSYEFLKLYLVPERGKADKERNRQTLQLANAVKAQRVLEVQSGRFGIVRDLAGKTLFFEYYKVMCEERKAVESTGNYGNWIACLRHMERYCGNAGLTFADVTPKWVRGFRDYLENGASSWSRYGTECAGGKPLSHGTKLSYFSKLKACLSKAVGDGVIGKDPSLGVEGFRVEDSRRMYLTQEEVRVLAATPCDMPGVKRAFLFSCLTGLRRSDVLRLAWGDVHMQGNYVRLIFSQKKTKGQEYLDISDRAAALLGERRAAGDRVFGSVPTPSATNAAIRRWVRNAGIDKDITFHCARHTFAVMMLDLGADIYTVSKLLGHRELSTTQVYAKVLDKNKQAAVGLIPDLLGSCAE